MSEQLEDFEVYSEFELGRGDIMGETNLRTSYSQPQQFKAVALETTEILELHHDDLGDICTLYPESRKELLKRLQKAWRKYRLRHRVDVRIRAAMFGKLAKARLRLQGSKQAKQGRRRSAKRLSLHAKEGQFLPQIEEGKEREASQQTGVDSMATASMSETTTAATEAAGTGEISMESFQTVPNSLSAALAKRTADDLARREQKNAAKGIFTSNCRFRLRWDSALFAALLFHAVVIPLQIAFLHEGEASDWILRGMAYVVDIFFLVDLYMHANHFISDRDPGATSKEAIRRSFFLHRTKSSDGRVTYTVKKGLIVWLFLSRFPLDIFGIGLSLRMQSFFRVGHLLLLSNISTYFTRVVAFLDVEYDLHITYQTRRLVQLGIFVGVFTHFIVSFWAFAGQKGDIFSELKGRVSWYDLKDFSLFAPDVYLYALYWGIMTITTSGYGDITGTINGELSYIVATIILSAVVNASIIGSISLRTEHSFSDVASHERQVDVLKYYMTSRQIDKNLRNRLLEYYRYIGENDTILRDSMMPQDFKMEISVQIYRKMAHSLMYAVNADVNVLSALSAVLRPELYLCGDLVMAKGDMLERMYFVFKGRAQVTGGEDDDENDNDEQLNLLGENDVFGEIGVLLPHQLAPYNVLCLTVLEVYHVTRNDWKGLLSSYPQRGIGIVKSMLKKIEHPEVVDEEAELAARLETYLEARTTETNTDSKHASSVYRQRSPQPQQEQEQQQHPFGMPLPRHSTSQTRNVDGKSPLARVHDLSEVDPQLVRRERHSISMVTELLRRASLSREHSVDDRRDSITGIDQYNHAMQPRTEAVPAHSAQPLSTLGVISDDLNADEVDEDSLTAAQ
jgi:CRP-like cAMP-binding protein